jgi:hypothetical protein
MRGCLRRPVDSRYWRIVQPGTVWHCVRLSSLHGVSDPPQVTVPPVHWHPGWFVLVHVDAFSWAHGVGLPTHVPEVTWQPTSVVHVDVVFALHGRMVPVQLPFQTHPLTPWQLTSEVYPVQLGATEL